MPKHVLDARPDTVDFRDLLYVPTLVEVQEELPLESYAEAEVPILDQGQEGACTGFGLATVAHYLLRTRNVRPDPAEVSPRMLYEMARRYDEWPGTDYSGSSARGAMKGWHKHGVCGKGAWPYQPGKDGGVATTERLREAAARPLGAYFRVNHRDLVAMHSAITEVGILYATATVHAGWEKVKSDGKIAYSEEVRGGHAFAIVAYDREGFWIQNSWGDGWGKDGFAHVSYADWLENGSDVWVARLGVPVELEKKASAKAKSALLGVKDGASHADVRPHVISLGNDGALSSSGSYANSAAEVASFLEGDLVQNTKNWNKRRVLLYAHGGLTGERGSVQRVGEYLRPLTDAQVWPVAFIWHTDFWTTVSNILSEAVRSRRPEGLLDKAKDFLLDRLDDGLEPIARMLGGKALWDEMKENALRATTEAAGGARLVLSKLDPICDSAKLELHVAGHSAGSIFMGPIVQWLTAPKGQTITTGPLAGAGLQGLGRKLASVSLWAPACSTQLFKDCYLPGIRSGAIKRFRLFTLSDEAEQDDHCGNIYHKSLLYLVSHSFEEHPRTPFFRPNGMPILGLERDIRADKELAKLFVSKQAPSASDAVVWLRSPNQFGEPFASKAMHHGDFDDDRPTVRSLLATMTSVSEGAGASFAFSRSTASRSARRKLLQ